MAGAIFGEVGVSLFVAGAAFTCNFWAIAGARNLVFFPYKQRLQDGTSKVSEAAGAG